MKKILTVLSALLLGCFIGQANEKQGDAGKFNRAEYMQATPSGQKKAAPSVKGALSFDAEKKCVDFIDKKGAPAFGIKYDAIKNILYEQTSKPRYAEAILI